VFFEPKDPSAYSHEPASQRHPVSCSNVLLLNSAFPLDLQLVSFFNAFPTKLYVFITITMRARCPNQSQDLKKLYFNRAKFGVKGHDAIDDGGFVILQMGTASSRKCGVWAKHRDEEQC